MTTKVVEFNDLDALENALRPGDVACVLAEPAMTNVGIVHPEPGYHRGLRELTRKYGSLLMIDETHTICAGPGGFTIAENLDPDFLIFGKAIGGGVPGAAYGFTQEVAEAIAARENLEECDVGGIGGTLAGNALSLAAMRATLDERSNPGSIRSHDSAGGKLDGRCASGHHKVRCTVACHATGMPRRISLLA